MAFANDKMSQFEDSLDKYILRKRTIVCLGSYTDNITLVKILIQQTNKCEVGPYNKYVK